MQLWAGWLMDICFIRMIGLIEAYSSALRQEYNVNIAGGTDKMQSYGSFGYLKDDGIVPSSNYERYSARFKGLYQAKKMDEIWC